MEQLSDWLLAAFGFLLAALGVNYRMDKKRCDDEIREGIIRDTILAERMARVEAELMTEKEVRKVLKEYFDPFMHNMVEMQKSLQDIRVQLASMPKRKEDCDHGS